VKNKFIRFNGTLRKKKLETNSLEPLTWSVITRSSFKMSANSYSADELKQVCDTASCTRLAGTAGAIP
jgi:hypothetical protein